MLKKFNWKQGNGTAIVGAWMMLLMLTVAGYISNYYVIEQKAADTLIAADSLSDGVAVQLSKKTNPDLKDAENAAEDLVEIINDNTGVNITEYTIDKDSMDKNIVDVDITTENYYTAYGSYFVAGDDSSASYLLSNNSATKFQARRQTQAINNVYYPSDGLEIPVMGQSWTPWGSMSFWSGCYADSGCGPTSYAMLVSYYLGEVITPDMLVAKGYGNSTGPESAYKVSNLYDIKKVTSSTVWDAKNNNKQRLKNYIETGHPVVVSVYGRNSGNFAHSSVSHIMIIRGLTEDNKVLFNDPSCGSDHCTAYPDGVSFDQFCSWIKYWNAFETLEDYEERHGL